MATLIVIVGYCGAGKTVVWRHLATAYPEAALMDGGFALPVDEGTQRERAGVLQALRDGRSAIVTSLECATAGNRDAVMHQVLTDAPGTRFLWMFFENDVEKANRNCRLDPNRQADVEGYIGINSRASAGYSIPAEAIVLKIHELAAS